jgi:GxGYxYP putative glycoside hydrolase C-terminal domain/GxGYxYP third domain/GxGYxYP_N 1st domain/GxGYxYP_N second domain
VPVTCKKLLLTAILILMSISAASAKDAVVYDSVLNQSTLDAWAFARAGGSDLDLQGSPEAITFSGTTQVKAGRWGGIGLIQPIPVEPGITYRLELESQLQQATRAYTSVVCNPAGNETRRDMPGDTEGYQKQAHEFTVPPGCSSITVRLAVDGPTAQWRVRRVSVLRTDIKLANLTADRTPRTHDSVFPRGSTPPAKQLVVFDPGDMLTDEALALATLQGIVNKAEPRIYIITRQTDRQWLDVLRETGRIEGWTEVKSAKALLAMYRKEISGAVCVDVQVPGSRHAAAFIAAEKNLIVCTPQMAKRLSLPIVEDLRGRWTRNVDAYRWAWETYADELSRSTVAVHHPLADHQWFRDYTMAHNVFTFWTSSPSDNLPGADPDAELAFLHEVLGDLPPAIPIMGWFTYSDNEGISEYEGVTLASGYGKYLSVSEFCSNLSVLSSFPVLDRVKQPRRVAIAPSDVAPDKVYLSFSMLDSGDCVWYWQHHQRLAWDDPARGDVPISWGLNPSTLDLMPDLIDWYYRTATPNDRFHAGLSGIGYMNTLRFGERYTETDRAYAWQRYLEDTASYMDRLDLDMIQMYCGGWGEKTPPARELYQRYADAIPNLRVVLSDFGRHDATDPDAASWWLDDVLVLHTLMRFRPWAHSSELAGARDETEVAWVVKDAMGHTPTQRPAVMSGLITSWTIRPTQAKQAAEQLKAAGIEVATPDQLYDIASQQREERTR